MTPFKRVGSVAIIWAGCLLLGYLGLNLFQQRQFAQAQQQVQTSRAQLEKVQDLSAAFRNVAKVVEPSVVNIRVTKNVKLPRRMPLPFDEDLLRRFFPDRDGDGEPDLPPGFGPGEDGFEQLGTGSGVIMESANGKAWIVTNNHVAGGADAMVITLWDGRKIEKAKVIGTDPKSDLAVIEIQVDRVIPAKWGNSDELQKGDWVLAFGSPFGYIGSMTHGIVSALERQTGLLGAQGYENFIQVDAPINPGNSGGPLVNLQGEVVGINTAIASRSGGFNGLGFAIPANQAKRIYDALRDKGKVVRGWLGVSIHDVADKPGKAASLGYDKLEGVLVDTVMANTPAASALKPGDIIVGLDGLPIRNVQQLRNAIAGMPPGQTVRLKVFRDGSESEVKVKLGEQPEDLERLAQGGAPESPGRAMANVLGIGVQTLNAELAKRYGLGDIKEGAVVVSIDRNSPAAREGLRVGDVITRIGKTPIRTAEDVTAALAKEDLSKGIQLYCVNKDGWRLVFVEAPKKD